MSKDIQGIGLELASKFAGSDFAEKYQLRQSAEKVAYLSTKHGFKFVGEVMKRKARKKGAAKALLPSPDASSPNASNALFDLSLSEEQQMIKDTLLAYADDVLRDQALAADEQQQLPQDFLTQMSELGLNSFSVPEALGGGSQQYSPMTNAIIAESLAWGDMSLAYAALASSAVANALVKWGNASQKNQYLPRYLDEKPLLSCIAVQEAQPLFDPQQLQTRAKKVKSGYRLTGEKVLVPFAGKADLYLVAALLKGKPALFLVPGNLPGIQFKSSASMGIRATESGTLSLTKVELPADALLGGDAFLQRPDNYREFIRAGQLHWCALAIGTCQAALDYVIPYCNEREAFGEPISHRQSVAFLIANMGIELESMRLLTWRAAALAEAGKPFTREAFLAHTLCSDKAMKIGTDAVQLLGGHGFTKEHPAERWYRDLRLLACVNSGLHL